MQNEATPPRLINIGEIHNDEVRVLIENYRKLEEALLSQEKATNPKEDGEGVLNFDKWKGVDKKGVFKASLMVEIEDAMDSLLEALYSVLDAKINDEGNFEKRKRVFERRLNDIW